jgi:hypothetical protein
MDDLVKTYIQVREKKSRLKAAYDAEKLQYDTLQDKIEALLLIKFGEMGIDSVKTEQGTAYASTATTASIADWDAYRIFCESQDDPYTFIERRANKSAIEQYRATTQDIPPGINWSETRTVNFRRKTNTN